MAEVKKASFSFKTFKVPSFSYENSSSKDAELKLDFNPSGKFISKKGRFFLSLEFLGYEEGKKEQPVIKVKSISEFRFSEPLDFKDIPPYFYSNSVAIVFPYLRAFISNLTLQSNTGVIMLGLLNFTGIGEVLKNSTKQVNE